ncbi:protein curvature thylakoid 1C, chloroplastic, partial [Tanacetum coccineum]
QQGRVAVIAKASGSSESSTSLNIVESVQSVWDKPEDRIALFGLGFASVVALWASLTLVTAIDKIPVVSGLFELIGIWFSAVSNDDIDYRVHSRNLLSVVKH